jgi:uncharacterized protein YdiU (UPF0061 family)
MALSGETIDYGPCAFMDAYDPATVFSSIDHQGRYAYGNQPAIAHWNLTRLAEAMLPLFDENRDRAVERATAALDCFPERFDHHWSAGMRAKLGLFREQAGDQALIDDLLAWMQRHSADLTNTFRDLTAGKGCVDAGPDFQAWHARWEARRTAQPEPVAQAQTLMRQHNPAFIPRNHVVEQVLAAATEEQDLAPLDELLDVLANPYAYERELPGFSTPGDRFDRYQTFCGT